MNPLYIDMLRALDVCIRYGISWTELTWPGHDDDVLGLPPIYLRATATLEL